MIESRAEAELLVTLLGSPQKAFEVLERQFGMLVIRSQALLMSNAAVVIVAAFGGRGATGGSRLLVLASIAAILLGSAVLSLGRSIPVTFITEQLEQDTTKFLANCIEIRRQRTSYLKLGTLFFVAGFVSFVAAMALPLLSSS